MARNGVPATHFGLSRAQWCALTGIWLDVLSGCATTGQQNARATPQPARGEQVAFVGTTGPADDGMGEALASESGDEQGATCLLLTTEAPRGGRLELNVAGVGRTPLVYVGGEVTRMLLRQESLIAVQIPRSSEGGAVTVRGAGREVDCGRLTIFGKN